MSEDSNASKAKDIVIPIVFPDYRIAVVIP